MDISSIHAENSDSKHGILNGMEFVEVKTEIVSEDYLPVNETTTLCKSTLENQSLNIKVKKEIVDDQLKNSITDIPFQQCCSSQTKNEYNEDNFRYEDNNISAISKRNKRKLHQYLDENIQKALDAVTNGAKIRETCRVYGIPRSTLQDRLTGRVANKSRQMGPDPYISKENENVIVEWIIHLAKSGFPIKKQELIDTVQRIVQKSKIKTPFKNGKPGQKWYTGFLRRHPIVSARTGESIDKSRAKLTTEYIKHWFSELQSFLNEMNAADVLKYQTRIFNAYESDFSVCPKTGKVLGPREKSHEKSNITVLVTFSADGKLCPPCVIYPYVKPPRAVVESIPVDWILGKSDSGLMKGDIFFDYVKNGLHKWIVKENIKKPVIFFVDGHRFHMSIELSQFCDDNGIILYALPPNAMHIMQPADVAVVKPLKEYWRLAVRTWHQENEDKTLTKTEFAPVFQKVFDNPNIPYHIQKGFRQCGLYPYNPQAVYYSKCVQNLLEKSGEKFQEQELSSDDFKCTMRVLNGLKSHLQEKNCDIDWLVEEVKKFEYEILGDQGAAMSNTNENIVLNDSTILDEF